ncbi:MAG: sialidase family protein [Dokdonella sp.]
MLLRLFAPTFRCAVLAGVLGATVVAARASGEIQPVTDGAPLDYQAAVIRSSDDGARIVVFERLDPATLYGDLWLTRSIDDGASWSTPVAIIATAANERHPALLQLGPANYVLFYLKGASASASFRLWRASSTDGMVFSEQAQLDLGWATGGEVNPHVIRHADGTLTMSYQRLGSGSYVAESADGGVTWDTLKTAIASGSQLPRIAYRDSDGLYLASYQVGSSALAMYVKTTTDVHDWSSAPQGFALDGNNHDSLPVVMPDGAFALFWIRAAGNQFDIAVRRSADGSSWQPALAVTDSADADDVEPHPLLDASADTVELYWGRGTPPGGSDYDIVRATGVPVREVLFVDGFDG